MMEVEGAAVWELFERGLAVCHVAHFLSFYVQIAGLIGRDGLRPVQETLRSIRVRWSPGPPTPTLPTSTPSFHSLLIHSSSSSTTFYFFFSNV